MTELTNSQLTNILINQNNTLQALIQKKMPKTILKDIKPNVTIEEFIENIELLEISKLLTYKLPNYYAVVIMHNLEKLDSKNHPIICTDARQKKLYYYTQGEWKLDKKIMEQIKSKIFHLVLDQIILMKKKTHNNEETCMCISVFFDVEKYPSEKLLDKIQIELGKQLPSINDLEFD
jgi:hypothetical protein